jgi:hypothetical protein
MRVNCPICGNKGTVMYKTTKTKTTTGEYKEYRKLYVYHGKPNQKWCYLKKEDLEKIQHAGDNYTNTTQMTTQTTKKQESLNLTSVRENRTEHPLGRSSSTVGRWLYEPKVAGSSPARPTNLCSCTYLVFAGVIN